MQLSQVVEIALAGAGPHEVEVSSLESSEISTEIVGSLTQIISELVQNATSFSRPGQRVRINGVFDGDNYLLTVSDDGVGIPEAMLDALNRVLASPGTGDGPNLGISLVARLAARTGLGVQLVAGVPGTTARILIPEASIVSDRPTPDRAQPAPRTPTPETIDLSRVERDFSPRGEHVVSVAEPPLGDVEEFLEKIFGPLRGKSQRRDRLTTRAVAPSGDQPSRSPAASQPSVEREPRDGTTTLRVRVPGQNFRVVEDDASVTSSEAAIDIRTALTKYESGRREAQREN